jgi:hypothetical protein
VGLFFRFSVVDGQALREAMVVMAVGSVRIADAALLLDGLLLLATKSQRIL